MKLTGRLHNLLPFPVKKMTAALWLMSRCCWLLTAKPYQAAECQTPTPCLSTTIPSQSTSMGMQKAYNQPDHGRQWTGHIWYMCHNACRPLQLHEVLENN